DKKPADVHREKETRMTVDSQRPAGRSPRQPSKPPRAKPERLDAADLVEQLRALESARKDGTITLPDGDQLAVTNLQKIFWPKLKLTKGDLFRYYAEAAPFVLPAIADRPLVMKRFPNGIAAAPFYQHRVADVPRGIRVETVSVAERRPQIIGGSLKTLMYT